MKLRILVVVLMMVVLSSFFVLAVPRFLGPPVTSNANNNVFLCFRLCIDEKNQDFSECSRNFRSERAECNRQYGQCVEDARNTSTTRKEFNDKKKICREADVECKKATEDEKREGFNNASVEFLSCMQVCRDNRGNSTCPSIQPPAEDFCLGGKIVNNGLDETGCRIPPSCLPSCGNGLCQDAVCLGSECPIAENHQNCPEDCKRCIPEGGKRHLSIEDKQCCEGLKEIAISWPFGPLCKEGPRNAAYCTYCGDGVCKLPENNCNCASDCPSIIV